MDTVLSSPALPALGDTTRMGEDGNPNHHRNDDDDDDTHHHRSMDEFLEQAYALATKTTTTRRTTRRGQRRGSGPHLSLSSSSSSSSSSSCWSWLQDVRGLGGRYWLVLLSLGLANSSDAAEILCLAYLLAKSDFQADFLTTTMVDDDDNDNDNEDATPGARRAGYVASAVFGGMLLGGLLVGFLGDSRGRKPTLLGGLVLNAVFGWAAATCPALAFWRLGHYRFMAGLGIGATVPSLFALVTELSPSSRRGAFVTVVASFWMVGAIYVALVALLLQHASWRWLAAASALPAVLGTVAVALFVPESPRYHLLLATQSAVPLPLPFRRSAAPTQTTRQAVQATTNHVDDDDETTSRATTLMSPTNAHNSHWTIATQIVNQVATWMMHPCLSLAQAHHLHHDDDDEEDGFVFWTVEEAMARHGFNSTAEASWGARGGQLLHPENYETHLDHELGPSSHASRATWTRGCSFFTSNSFSTLILLYSNRELRWKSTIPLQWVWFLLSFGSYGLGTWINSIFVAIHLRNLYTNALLFALCNLPGNLVTALFLDGGRRQQQSGGRATFLGLVLLASALSLMWFASVAQNISVQDDNDNDNDNEAAMETTTSTWQTMAIVTSACCYQAWSTAAWNTLDVMTGEMFPTAVRTTGMGICTASGRIGALVAQWVNGALLLAASSSSSSSSDASMVLWLACGSFLLAALTPHVCSMHKGTRQALQDVVQNGSDVTIAMRTVSRRERANQPEQEEEGQEGLEDNGHEGVFT